MRPLRVLLAALLVLLTVPVAAWAHGDASTHYLETSDFYPGFSVKRASQASELQLMGLMDAAKQAGYTPTIYGFDPGATAPSASPGLDPRVWGFRREFTEIMANRAKGFKYHVVESDSGPGPAADLGRSLRHAKISAKILLGMK